MKRYDKDGETRYESFQAEFWPALEKGLADGKNLHTQLFNPKSPDFLGHIVESYISSDADDLAGKLADPEPAPSWWGKGLAGFMEAIGQSDYAIPRAEPLSASSAGTLIAAPVMPPVDPSSIKSAGELKALLAAKQISWDDAAKLAMERGWVKKPPPSPPQVPMSQ